MSKFSIYSKDGSTVRYSGEPKYNGTYMKVSYIEFSEIASPVPIDWEIGDYLDYPRMGLRYKLYSVPQPKKQARRNEYGGAFVYSNVQLYEATKELEIALFNDLVLDAEKNTHFSTRESFSTYEDVYGIARRIQANMDEFYPDQWVIQVMDLDATEDADLIAILSEAKDFTVSTGSCLGALNQIYNTWEGIGWIHTYDSTLGKDIITIGRPNKRDTSNTSSAFLYGLGNGLTAIKRSYTNTDEFCTRLYVYGSDRNLPNRYYNGKEICNAASVDIANLMIPASEWGTATDPDTGDVLPDASQAYIEDSDKVAAYGLIPKKVYFDGSSNEEIYPSIKNMTVGKLRKAKDALGDTTYVPNQTLYPDDDERLDVIKEAVNPTDNGYESDEDEFVFSESVECYVENFSGTMKNSSGTDTSVTLPTSVKKTVLTYTPTTSGTRVVIRPDYTFLVYVNPQADKWTVKQVATVVVRKADGTVFTMDTDDTTSTLSPVPLGNNGSYAVSMAEEYVIATGTIVSIQIDLLFERESGKATDMTVNVRNRSDSDDSHGTCLFGFKEDVADTFKLYLKQIGFNIADCTSLASNGIATISMKDGMCGGRDFTVKRCTYRSDTDDWELTVKRATDSSVNMTYPNASFPIAAGDTFVLLDIEMPELYIKAAEETLLDAAKSLYDELSVGKAYYEPDINAIQMAKSGEILKEGMYMRLQDADIIEGGTDYILIDTITIAEDEAEIPTYKVTLREKKAASYRETTATAISNLALQISVGGGGQRIPIIASNGVSEPADDNVFSALRSEQEFLSKKSDDTAAGEITLKKGVKIGEYAEGLTGYGGAIDSDGHGELDSLTLRRWLEVPELRYNRVQIQVGNSWRSPGGGIIETVTPDYDSDGTLLNTGTITLKLEDGEIGTVALDDICMGIYHDGIDDSNNSATDADDSLGNFHFSGFYSCYFRVTEILTSDNSSFKYAVRPVSENWTETFHPTVGMHFVAYGNFSDATRQTSRYSTRTYERYLKDVASWEFSASNIAAQFGDLSNLSVFGLDMTGYSAYLENIYMSGVIQQFENSPIRIDIDTNGQNTIASDETISAVSTVYKGWDDVTSKVTAWKIVRDTGDSASDSVWNSADKASAFSGSVSIEYADLGSNGESALFTVTATIEDESAEKSFTVRWAGADGVGISSVDITYGVSADANTEPTEWLTAAPDSISKGSWLWVKTVYTYTDGSSKETYSKSYSGTDGSNGKDGTNGVGISSTAISYGVSANGSTQPTSWDSTVPTLSQGDWLWCKTVYTYSDGSTKETFTKSYIGTDGDDGSSVNIQSVTKTDGVTTVTLTDGTSTQTLTIDDGADGAQGVAGPSGKSVHIAWATSSDGSTGFSTTESEGKTYIGVYTDTDTADSEDYTKYSWSLIKGKDGSDGKDGSNGKDGTDGLTTLTYYKWSDSVPDAPTDTELTASAGTPSPAGWAIDPAEPLSYQNPDSSTYADWSDSDGARRLNAGTTKTLKAGELIKVLLPAGGSVSVTASILADTYDYVYISGLYEDKASAVSDLAAIHEKSSYSSLSAAQKARAARGSYTEAQSVTASSAASADGTYWLFVAYHKDVGDLSTPSGWDGGYAVYSVTPYYSTGATRYSVSGTGTLTKGSESSTFSGIVWSDVIEYANNGSDGKDGSDGNGIASSTVEYAVSADADTQPGTDDWSTSVPALTQGTWLWARTTITFTDGTTEVSYTKSYIGTDGEDGTSVAVTSVSKTDGVTTVTLSDGNTLTIEDGSDGAQGIPGPNGKSVHIAWATSADGSEGFSTSESEGKTYIGMYTDESTTDSETYSDYSWSLIKGADGKDGETGNGIASTLIEYGVSSDANTEPTEWVGVPPTSINQGYWLWTRTTISFTDGSATEVSYSKSYIGTDGAGISSVTEYYASSDSSTTAPTSWTATTPTDVSSSAPYRWHYTHTVYTDGTHYDTEPAVVATFAANGISYRYSAWVSGTEYRNDNNPYYRDENGQGVVDVVFRDSLSLWDSVSEPDNPPDAYVCLLTHTAGTTTDTTSGIYALPSSGSSGNAAWSKINSMKPILTALVIAARIKANYIDVDSIVAAGLIVTDADGNEIVHLQGQSETPFYIKDKDGNLVMSFNSDGTLMVSGGVMAGSETGQSVVIDPDTQQIRINDSNGNTVTQMDSETVSSLDTLLPGTSGSSTVGTYSTSAQTLTATTTSTSKSVQLASFSASQITTTGQLTVNIASISVNITYTPAGSANVSLANPQLRLTLKLGSTTLWTKAYNYYNQVSTSYTASDTDISVTASVVKGGAYNLTLYADLIVGASTGVTATVATTVESCTLTGDAFLSRLFGNGLVISNASDQYFAAMMESKNLRFQMQAGDYGQKLTTSGPMSLVGGIWAPQPRTLMYLRLCETSSSVTISKSFLPSGYSMSVTTSTSPSAGKVGGYVSRTAKGTVTIYFPTDWSSLGISSGGFIQATVRSYGASSASDTGARRYVTVYELTNSKATLLLCKGDDLYDNGYIDVELKIC